jgi:hypothetical protein
MHAADYLKKADRVMGFSTELERVRQGINAAKRRASLTEFVQGVNDAKPKYVPYGVGAIGGAAAGGYIFRKSHPVLGVIGGVSLGNNLPALLNPQLRNMALSNMVMTGSGIAGSVLLGGRDGSAVRKIGGFLLGLIAGAVTNRVTGLDAE